MGPYRRAATVVACLIAVSFFLAAPAQAEDIPAFQYAYGQPAIRPATDYHTWYYGYSHTEVAPPIAADSSRIYVGGRDINLFNREGDWLDFWPFSSSARAVGELDPLLAMQDRSFHSQALEIEISPWGDIYVLDRDWAAVHRYSPAGEFLGGWGGHDGDSRTGFYRPVALCASADSSVYVLDVGPGRIKHFSATGDFLNLWNTPTAAGDQYCVAVDIAAAQGSGVWLLNERRDSNWDLVESSLHRYAPDGTEEISWTLGAAYAYDAEVDPAGNVWVLLRHDSQMRLQPFDSSGTPLADLLLDNCSETFTISPDSRVFLAVKQIWYEPWGCEYPTYRIEVRDFAGNLLQSFGDSADVLDRGAIVGCRSMTATPEGETYTWVDLQSWLGWPYVTRYNADGETVEVIWTSDLPVYNPVTESVEFVAERRGTLGPDGNWYSIWWFEAVDIPEDYDHVVWTVRIGKYSADGELIRAFDVPGPIAPVGYEESGCYRCVLGPDGNLRVAVCLLDYESYDLRVLWVGTVDTEGQVLSSWADDNPPDLHWVDALEVDGGENIYVGGDRLLKYSANGQYIGRIGGWGGEGDQRWSSHSLIHEAADVHIDSVGRLRVLDRAANRILVFAYTPGAFPDVPYYHWAKEAVRAAVEAGIVSGYLDGLYHPERSVTRDQMAIFVSRALAGGDEAVPEPDPEAPPSFTDVPKDHWAYKYIEYAVAQRVVTGYGDGAYRPNATVGRAQMAVFIARSRGWVDLEDDMTTAPDLFPDVPAGFWAGTAIEVCGFRNVVKGYPDGYFRPYWIVTRDQMAVFIARAFELLG